MKCIQGIRLVGCLLAFFASVSCASQRASLPMIRAEKADEFIAQAGNFSANAQYDGANYFLGRAVEILCSEGRWREAIQCLVRIGNNWQKSGNMEQAQAAFARALQLTLEHDEGGNLELSKSLQQLAFKRMANREYAAALELMNRSLAIQQRIHGPDHPELGKIFNSLALLHLHLGDNERALEFANKSISAKIRKYMNTDSSFLRNYSFLDGVSISERSFEDMSGMLDRSLVVYLESLGSGHPLVAAIYEKLGMVCALQGAYEQGLDFFRKALRIWLDAVGEGDARVGVLYEEIGICLRLQGNLPEARRYLEQAQAIAGKSRQTAILASIHFQTGKVSFLENKFDEALHHYRISLSLLSPGLAPGTTADSPGGETVANKQDLLEILAAQSEAFEARSGMNANEKKDLQEAFAAIRGAVQLIVDLRADYKSESYRLLFGEKTQRILDLAVRVAVKLHRATGNPGYKESAFDFSEKSKAALLAENMLESDARLFSGIPADKLSRERELKDELARCETLLQKQAPPLVVDGALAATAASERFYSLLAEYQRLIASFERQYPQYFELKYGTWNASLPSLQRSLPDNTALVEYFLGSNQLHIFFLDRERFEVVSQSLEPQFSESISAYCLAIKKIDEKSFLRLSPVLYQVLVAPFEGWLRGKEKLIVIPDRILANVPFETLVRRELRTSDFSKLDFLIRRLEISYHFSGRLWQSRRQRGAVPREESWAGFAPVFSGDNREGFILSSDAPANDFQGSVTRSVAVEDQEFPELPGTEEELRSIIGLFAARKKKALGFFHSQATEQRFKSRSMQEYSMIHLATHSLTDEANPKLSGFLFSPRNSDRDGEDGILYTGETYGLSLDCSLLVLSSCESGAGRLVEGEGLLALTRGLFYSGARNIVYSLGKVEDRATGQLMVNLYQNILRGDTFAAALRQAKLAFIADPYKAFPKYWAGFILLGD